MCYDIFILVVNLSLLFSLGTETFCVVAGNENNIRVQNVCKLNTFDVVKAEWLMNCMDSSELLPWTPVDMISKSETTAEKMAVLYDEYDDSYTQPATEQSLKRSLQKVQFSVRKYVFLD